jgi:hypothetical protein
MYSERYQICTSGLAIGGQASGTQFYNLWALGAYSSTPGTTGTMGTPPAFYLTTPTSTPQQPTTFMLAPVSPLKLANGTAAPTFSNQPITWRFGLDSDAGAAAPTGIGPNASAVKIVPFQASPRGQTACDPRVPQTPHAAGILCGMGDGSVRTTAATISEWTFAAACTPAGNETLGSDW